MIVTTRWKWPWLIDLSPCSPFFLFSAFSPVFSRSLLFSHMLTYFLSSLHSHLLSYFTVCSSCLFFSPPFSHFLLRFSFSDSFFSTPFSLFFVFYCSFLSFWIYSIGWGMEARLPGGGIIIKGYPNRKLSPILIQRAKLCQIWKATSGLPAPSPGPYCTG
jgi:hypothetical protein